MVEFLPYIFSSVSTHWQHLTLDGRQRWQNRILTLPQSPSYVLCMLDSTSSWTRLKREKWFQAKGRRQDYVINHTHTHPLLTNRTTCVNLQPPSLSSIFYIATLSYRCRYCIIYISLIILGCRVSFAVSWCQTLLYLSMDYYFFVFFKFRKKHLIHLFNVFHSFFFAGWRTLDSTAEPWWTVSSSFDWLLLCRHNLLLLFPSISSIRI